MVSMARGDGKQWEGQVRGADELNSVFFPCSALPVLQEAILSYSPPEGLLSSRKQGGPEVGEHLKQSEALYMVERRLEAIEHMVAYLDSKARKTHASVPVLSPSPKPHPCPASVCTHILSLSHLLFSHSFSPFFTQDLAGELNGDEYEVIVGALIEGGNHVIDTAASVHEAGMSQNVLQALYEEQVRGGEEACSREQG